MIRFLTLALFFLSPLTIFASSDEACEKAYNDLYKEKELRLSIFIGYGDYDDEVTDQYDKAEIADVLVSPCVQNSLCDFKRDPDNSELFYKTIVGPDGQDRQVRLQVVASSLTESDSTNRGVLANLQEEKSKLNEKAFLKALETDQVVIYTGHARRGTGPGFRPMGALAWIQAARNRESLQKMVDTLKKAKKTPQILGMVTCDGESHYGHYLHEAAPKSGLLLTRQASQATDTLYIAMNTLNSVLERHCQDKFRSHIKDIVNYFSSTPYETKTYAEKLPELYGFFEPITKKFEPRKSLISNIINGSQESVFEVPSEKRDDSEKVRSAK